MHPPPTDDTLWEGEVNPQLQTPNPKPSTLNPKSQIPNAKRQTLEQVTQTVFLDSENCDDSASKQSMTYPPPPTTPHRRPHTPNPPNLRP